MVIDAKQLRARGAYDARVPLRTLFDDIDQIGRMLEEMAALRKRIRLIAGVSILAGLASVFTSGVLSNKGLAFFGLLALVFGVILFVYSFIDRGLLKCRDRVAMMKDLSKSLQPDTDLRSVFAVRLALKRQPQLVSEEAWLARNKGKQRFFEEEFLSLEGELLDGTVLTETVKELTRKRTYVNQNRKSKTKIRQRYLATLRFVYPDDMYGDARPACAALQEAIRVPASATLRDRRVTEKAIVVKAVAVLTEDVVRTSAMLSLGVYRILNLARRVAAGRPAKNP
jgi:hypothetical protein